MILFGRKVYHLGLQELKEDTCSSCGSRETVVSLFQQYFHILWVPIFPTKKRGAAQCLNCRMVTKEAAFSINQKQVIRYLKSKYKTPAWCFMGVAIFFILLLIKYI